MSGDGGVPIVLVANRGVIARRILRSVRGLGWRGVAVYSEADADTPPVREADEAVAIGGSQPSSSYLDAAKILNAARHTGATIIHPGYGFLSENADFAEACESGGLAFAGPTAEQIRRFGLKNTARDLAREAGVPLLPGTDVLGSIEEALVAAGVVGYPVMLKATAGGGGIGMQACANEAELCSAYQAVSRLGASYFRNAGIFLEKLVRRARHIEVQIFGDGCGRVIALGERDCSVQRRNQKVIEECPAPGLDEEVRMALHAAAVGLGESVGYRSAGTVEFLYDEDSARFYFLEVNTRLQVEHGVTEEVYGVDLVAAMLRLAAGDEGCMDGLKAGPSGSSMQARVYAEVPWRNFQPSTGVVGHVQWPEGTRVETWIEAGCEVGAFYDPMIAKIITHASTREEARAALSRALGATRIDGVETNCAYTQAIVDSAAFTGGGVTTAFLKDFSFRPSVIDVVDGGIESLVVDWPGRVGYWNVGVPPSGPFDDASLRLANRLLGNPEGAPGLEMAVRGPALLFQTDAWVCLAGAEMGATIDGMPAARGIPFIAKAGQTLRVGEAGTRGLRGYLAVKGGLDVPLYLGSATTFRLGRFGGHGGRALRAGDALRLKGLAADGNGILHGGTALEEYPEEWVIGVAYGPHGAPDFFTDDDIAMFFRTAWEVHYNSTRTGVRLVGPKPRWARHDGGEAGLHPSNIHDNAYQVGAVDFTGDMPIILGPDGPSLGGFVCPATVVSDELWKVGQLRPGDRVRFQPLSLAGAATVSVAALESPAVQIGDDVVARRQGDTGVLVEFGDMVLDLHLRFRVQALYEALRATPFDGQEDLTPGIRSLQVRYNPGRIDWESVIGKIRSIPLPPVAGMVVPTRTVHLPLSWDDESTRLAIEKYMQSVRPDAPWCPSNIEFIRRINGLATTDEVREIVYSASYLVLGLGDVYLGAPVATPLDPRHRLVTTKYNPARTWTPENAVGIGGAYMCIYGMEGPGGYQFVGRTVPVWNTHRRTRAFEVPWLLRFFDQIRFYPVTHGELQQLRADMLTGRFVPEIEEGEFALGEYDAFLAREAESIAAFRRCQREAFAAERERWKEAGEETALVEPEPAASRDVPKGCEPVCSPTAGNVWRVLVSPGQAVESGETVAILESMKMEIACPSPVGGIVEEVMVAEGRPAAQGQTLMAIRPT